MAKGEREMKNRQWYPQHEKRQKIKKHKFENSVIGSHWNVRRVIDSGVFKGIKSIHDLIANISKLENQKTKGAAWEIFRKWYMTKVRGVSEFWYSDQVPFEILVELRAPADDKGIDCVYRDVDGTLVAGQDKFRSRSDKNLSWTELCTFFGLAEYAPHRSIFTNCKGVSSTVNKKDRWSLINDFSKIRESQWKSIEPWLTGGRKVKVSPFKNGKRYRHQIDAIKKNIKMFEDGHDRLTNILPCATGKTRVAIGTLKGLDPKSVVLFFPSVGLLNQSEIEYVKHVFNELFKFFSVTHDTTVAADMEMYNDAAYDCEFPVTTIPAELRAHLADAISEGKRIAVFSTYQSVDVVSKASKDLVKFDLGIFDEAHWTAGPRNKEYAKGLFDSNIQIKKRLFLTATPSWTGRNRDLFNSMRDEDLYGPWNVEMSFREAIDRGLICDYDLITPEINSEDIDRDLINVSKVELNGKLERSRLVADSNALRKGMDQYSFSKSFVFLNGCKAAKDFHNVFKELNPDVKCFYLDAHSKAHKRKQVLKSFSEADKAILVNVDVLSEGIDVPNADCVFFAEPRSSVKDIMQGIGRVLRLYDGKEKAYILISTYVQKTEDEDINEALYKSKYEIIGNVAQALAQYDRQWQELLEKIIKEATSGTKPPPIGEDPEPWIDFLQLTNCSIEKSVWIRSILDTLDSHDIAFEMTKNRYEEEGNWNFVASDTWRQDLPRAIVNFVIGARRQKKVGDEESVYYQYLPWLSENGFPFETKDAEFYSKYVFMRLYEELVEVSVSKDYDGYSSLTDNHKTRLRTFNRHEFATEEQRKMIDALITPKWRCPRLYSFSQEIEEVRNNPNTAESKDKLSRWNSAFNRYSKNKKALLEKLFKDVGFKPRKEKSELSFNKRVSEWAELKSNDALPKIVNGKYTTVLFSDGANVKTWEHEIRAKANKLSRGQKIDLEDAGFILDLEKDKLEKAFAFIKRLKDFEDEFGSLAPVGQGRNCPPHLKHLKKMPKDLVRFTSTIKASYRAIARGKKSPTPYTQAVFKEINEQLKSWVWMSSKTKKIPNISECERRNGDKSKSYQFSVTFDGKLRNYRRKDLELLEEMRDKVMEAGHHIDFPKPQVWNKGRDNWKKKAEAKKEANKEYWEVHGWNDEKIQILKDNYKELTDEELSEGLLKSHTPKAISSKREELGLLRQKRSDSEPIELRIRTIKPKKGNTRYNIYIGIDNSNDKKIQVNFSSSDKKLTEKALAFYQEKINNWGGTYQELKDSFVYDKQRNRKELEAEAQELGIPIVSERGNPLDLGSLARKIESVKAGTYKKKSSRKELEARARELGVSITTKSRGNVGAGGKPMPLRDLARAIERAKAGLLPKRNRKELEARALKLGVSITTDPYKGYEGGEPLGLKRLEEKINEAENK